MDMVVVILSALVGVEMYQVDTIAHMLQNIVTVLVSLVQVLP
jgi:hypothetical protein